MVTRSRSSAAFRHRPCIAVSAVIRRGIARNFALKEIEQKFIELRQQRSRDDEVEKGT
jgi:hypothetical protein